MRALTLMSAAALIGAVALSASLGGPAGAETLRADRFEMKPVDGGFLRLDRDTGATAFCSASADGYACTPAGEDRAGSQAEITRLEARVATLEEQVRTLGAGLPPTPALPKDGSAPKDEQQSLNLPTDKQIDDLASFFERAVRRMKKLATELEKDAPADDQRL